MGKLGREIERAHALAAPAAAGLALMITRGQGSKALLLIEAEKLEKAARLIREAVGVE
jgi:hypothetical protein